MAEVKARARQQLAVERSEIREDGLQLRVERLESWMAAWRSAVHVDRRGYNRAWRRREDTRYSA